MVNVCNILETALNCCKTMTYYQSKTNSDQIVKVEKQYYQGLGGMKSQLVLTCGTIRTNLDFRLPGSDIFRIYRGSKKSLENDYLYGYKKLTPKKIKKLKLN